MNKLQKMVNDFVFDEVCYKYLCNGKKCMDRGCSIKTNFYLFVVKLLVMKNKHKLGLKLEQGEK